MAFDPVATMDVLTSHAAALGVFDSVNGFEPKSAPGRELSCWIWMQRGPLPLPSGSGLSGPSCWFEFAARIMLPMLHEPQSEIETLTADAVVKLYVAIVGDFTLGGNVRNVEILGEGGLPSLGAEAAYIDQDNRLFRAQVLSIPFVVNDVATYVA